MALTLTRQKPDVPVAPVVAGVARVDLMPRIYVEKRQSAERMMRWGLALIAAVLFCGLVIGAAGVLNMLAGQRLANEQTRTLSLLSEMARMSEVSTALTIERNLETFREGAMASDLEWTPLHQTLTRPLPAGVTLVGFDLTVGGVPVDDDPTKEIGLTGDLTFSSPNPVEIVSVIRAYRALPGVIHADGRDVTSEGTGEGALSYSYLLTITLDQTVYTATATRDEDE